MEKGNQFRLGVFLGAIIGALLIITGPNLLAQLQQSGGPGSTVTIGTALPAGGNVIGHVIVDTAPTTAVTGTFFQATQPVSLAAIPALVASTATIGAVIPKTACGTTVANQDLAAVPTSATAVFASTTCLMGAYFNNTNGSAQTVTLTDNAGSPINGIGPAFSVPALSNLFLPYNGIRFASGVKWTAGGSGVTGAMWGFQ